MRTIYVVLKSTEENDPDRTIETVAEEVKEQIIQEYYNRNDIEPNTNHDRITITAGVVVED